MPPLSVIYVAFCWTQQTGIVHGISIWDLWFEYLLRDPGEGDCPVFP